MMGSLSLGTSFMAASQLILQSQLEVFMAHRIAEIDDLTPRDAGVLRLQFRTEMIGGFAHDFEWPLHRQLGFSIRLKFVEIHGAGKLGDSIDGLNDVEKPFAITGPRHGLLSHRRSLLGPWPCCHVQRSTARPILLQSGLQNAQRHLQIHA